MRQHPVAIASNTEEKPLNSRRGSDVLFFLVMGGISACFILLIVLLLAADVMFSSPGEFYAALAKPEIRAAMRLTIFFVYRRRDPIGVGRNASWIFVVTLFLSRSVAYRHVGRYTDCSSSLGLGLKLADSVSSTDLRRANRKLI